jgi:hypothetical protein
MIIVDAETLNFETWNLRDLKHFCVVGNAFLERNETSHGPTIQRVLQQFLSWYDGHWLQPKNFPIVKEDDDHDWIVLARKVVKYKELETNCVIA